LKFTNDFKFTTNSDDINHIFDKIDIYNKSLFFIKITEGPLVTVKSHFEILIEIWQSPVVTVKSRLGDEFWWSTKSCFKF